MRRFEPGDIVLRAGIASAELFGLIEGAVRIELGDGGRRVQLVAPQCFGELSALTGDPVSATVVAHRDVQAWVLSAPVLFEAMAQETAFFRNVATLLGMRLRERTRRAPTRRPRVVLLPLREEGDRVLLAALGRGLHHYAPGSEQDHGERRPGRRARAHAPLAGGRARRRGAAARRRRGRVPRLAAGPRRRRRAARCRRRPVRPAACARPAHRLAARAALGSRGPAALVATAASGRDRGRRLGRRLVARAPAGARPPGAAALRPRRRRRHERRRGRRAGPSRRARGDRGRRPADRLPRGSSMGGAVALAFAHFGSARAAKDEILRLVAPVRAPQGPAVAAARLA